MRRAILLLLVAGGAYAEPSADVSWLMNEPLTMWDYGMIRTERDAEEALVEVGYSWAVRLSYDWDRNRLWVTVTFTDFQNVPSAAVAKSFCPIVVGKIRWALGVNGRGEGLGTDGHPLFPLNFSHRGFATDDQPDGLAKSLGDMTTIRVIVATKEQKNMVADAPLMSSDIFFKD